MNLPSRLQSTAVCLPICLLLLQRASLRFVLGIVVISQCTAEYHRLSCVPRPIVFMHVFLNCCVLVAALSGVASLLSCLCLSLFIVTVVFLLRHSQKSCGPLGPQTLQAFGSELFGVIYIALTLSHAAFYNWCSFGESLLLYVLVITFTAEIAALFLGWSFGHVAPAPLLSPNKTMAGYVSAMLTSIGVSFAFPHLLRLWSNVPFPLEGNELLLCGFLLGVVGAIGDLFESFLKRCHNVKDAGRLLPGWGGLLDRVDGVLFNVPFVYYYLLLRAPLALQTSCPPMSPALLLWT